MRTAQVIRRFKFSEWGGTENVVWNSVRELAALGDSPEILATEALGGVKQEMVENIPMRRFPYCYPYWPLSAEKRLALDKKGGNPFVFGLEKYLRKTPFELIHCHNPGRIAEIAARAAKARGVPLVLSFHGGCLDVPEAERRELLAPMRHTIPWGGILERVTGRLIDVPAIADALICVGENELPLLQARFPGRKIRFLPNGVSPAKFSAPARYDWRSELKIKEGTELILCVSRIDYQKNQILLVRLLDRLCRRGESAHLLLIGPVSAQWYHDELLRTVHAFGMDKRVSVVPGLQPDDPKLIAAYQQADMFILPSLHEPFGIVVLEAWSAGLPVIASDVGGLGRLVEDGETGILFDSTSPDSLLRAFDDLKKSRDYLVKNASRLVRERYDWRVIGAELREFYHEVCDEVAVRR